MAEKEKIKIIVLEPTTASVEELLKGVLAKGQADVERVASSAEVVQLTAMYQPCMMIIPLIQNGDVPDRVTMLKKMETSLKKGLVKTMFVTPLKNAQVANLITALGVTDFIQEPVPVRTMQFKLNLQIKAVDTVKKQLEMKRQSNEAIVFKKNDAAKPGDAASAQGAKSQPALQLKQDSFLFRNNGVKKNGKKYTIEMEGPDPSTGEWKQHEDKGDAQTAWRWVPNEDEEGKPAKDTGEGWVHAGDKPTFNEQSGKWAMTSEKPDLSYMKDGRKLGRKVSTDAAGEVNVAADSPAALENLEKNKKIAVQKREREAKAKSAPIVKKERTRPEAAESEAPEADDPNDSPAQKMLKKMARDKLARAKAMLAEGKEPAAESEEELIDDSSAPEMEEEASVEGASPSAIEAKKREKKKKSGLSPLDYLKQKMEAGLNSNDPATAEEIEPELESESETESSEEETISEGSPLGVKSRGGKKKSAAEKSMDALARMKGLLDKDSSSGTEEEQASSEEAPELEPTESEEAEKSEPKAAQKEQRERKLAAVPAPEAEAESDLAEGKALAKNGREKKKSRREILAEIQETLNAPLPDAIPAEEEAELRKKYNLEGRSDVKAKDIARKDRLDRIKRLKDSLAEAEEAPPAEEDALAPETRVHDLSEEERGLAMSNLTAEERADRLRAFDSEEAVEAEAEEKAKLKRKREEKSAGKSLFDDSATYLPAASVDPMGNAWENTDGYFVYLAADIHYHGFDKLEDLLPLWIFKGTRAPELLDKTNQWRFFGPVPNRARTVADIPPSVKDYLLRLRDKIRHPAPKEEKSRPESQADGLEEAHNKAHDRAEDELAKRRARLEGIDDSPEASEEDSLAEAAADLEASEDFSSPQDSKSAADGNADRLAALRSKLDGGSEQSITSDAPEGSAPNLSESQTSATLEKLKTASPAMEKFLERRKKKKEEADAAAASNATPANKEAKAASGTTAYLGVYVAMSNSLGHVGHEEKSIKRVLNSMEQAFGQCAVALLDSNSEGSLHQVRIAAGDGLKVGDRVALAQGIAAPIRKGDGESAEILGYLLLVPGIGRTGFGPDEESTLQKAAQVLWAVLAPQAKENAA